MADRVAELLEQRLRIRGNGLAAKLHKGGRLLPRRVRAAAEVLQASAAMAQNPKLLLQVDVEATAQAYDVCLKHLNGSSFKGRRKNAVLSVAASWCWTRPPLVSERPCMESQRIPCKRQLRRKAIPAMRAGRSPANQAVFRLRIDSVSQHANRYGACMKTGVRRKAGNSQNGPPNMRT